MTQNNRGLLSLRRSVMALAMVSMAVCTCSSGTRQSASAMTWFISATVSVITIGCCPKRRIIPKWGDRREGRGGIAMSVIVAIGRKPRARLSVLALVNTGVAVMMAANRVSGSWLDPGRIL